MSIEELLTKGSKIKSSNLKLRLIKEKIKENKCEICGISEWQGKPIVCQLHHKDGDNTNNILENLQILCPNCHSQTDTYCSGQKSKYAKNYCKNCGKEISKGATYCSDCYYIIERKVERPTKKQLLTDFQELHSFTKVGKKYNLSGAAIKKWYISYNILDNIKL